MGKKIDLSKKITNETKITRNLRTTYTHSFNYTNFINGVTTELEETEEEQETTENLENLNEQEDDDNTTNDAEKENNDNQDDTENLNENSNNVSNLNKNLNKAKDIKNKLDKLKKTEKTAKKAKDAKKVAAILKNPLTIKILLVILIVALVAFGIIFLIILITNITGSNSLSFGGYYDYRCNEMTVIFVDSSNGYEVTGSQTYSMEDYVAGVVYAEVGGAYNKEVYKTFALAARTFGLKHASEDCSIEGSARRQAFKDITDRPNEAANMIYEAVQETEGQVLISNGELYSIQYDAFCYVDKDSSYYTLSQKNQKIPTDWVESNIGSFAYKNCPCNLKDESMTSCWSNGTWQDGGHGRGMSQYGSYYLAKELGYTYDEILNYYYGADEVTISSNSFNGSDTVEGITSIAGLEIKSTTKAKNSLNQPLDNFLNSKGSSLDNMNNFIHDSVVKQGAGTRAGVVTAAVSMINYLYDNFDTKLPYYWGGSSERIGLPSTFGTYSPSSASRGGNIYYYKSFDCSGFVSWAIKNGGYNFSRISTSGFDSQFSKNSCNITDSSCVGQPGDLINSKSGHVELIIATDQENGKYFIAHSGNDGVVMVQRDMHTKHSGSSVTKIIYMDEFYNNQLNVNPSY